MQIAPRSYEFPRKIGCIITMFSCKNTAITLRYFFDRSQKPTTGHEQN